MSRCVRRSALSAIVVPFVLACSEQPDTVAIGFASNMGKPSVADVAQAMIDDTHQPGQPRIVVTLGDSTAPPPSTLPREVDRALWFARNTSVVALVGPGGSREALQTAPVYRDAGLPNLIPTATSGRLRQLGPLSFQLAPNDSIQGEFIGQFVADELGARSVAIAYLPDEYGVGLAAGSAAALASRGVKLTTRLPVRRDEICQPRAPTNPYDGVVSDLLGYGEPDVVVLATRSIETSCVARALFERAPGTRFVAGDGALVERFFVSQAGGAADSIYLVAFWHRELQDSASLAFVERFKTIVNREPRHDEAMFYDAVMIATQAIRDGARSREAVATYLTQLGRSRPPYRGITGSIAFTPGSSRPLIMTRLRNGRPEPIPVR